MFRNINKNVFGLLKINFLEISFRLIMLKKHKRCPATSSIVIIFSPCRACMGSAQLGPLNADEQTQM